MSDPNDFVICGGGAKPEDTHLASTVHCVGDEIIEWLARRERKWLRCGPGSDQTPATPGKGPSDGPRRNQAERSPNA
jgi:hypothetical protein